MVAETDMAAPRDVNVTGRAGFSYRRAGHATRSAFKLASTRPCGGRRGDLASRELFIAQRILQWLRIILNAQRDASRKAAGREVADEVSRRGGGGSAALHGPARCILAYTPIRTHTNDDLRRSLSIRHQFRLCYSNYPLYRLRLLTFIFLCSTTTKYEDR